jgi:hypothetical protein
VFATQATHTLEREYRGVLARAKHVHDRLTGEQSDGDTNGDCDHGTADIDAVPICSDTAGLRETRLVKQQISSRVRHG